MYLITICCLTTHKLDFKKVLKKNEVKQNKKL